MDNQSKTIIIGRRRSSIVEIVIMMCVVSWYTYETINYDGKHYTTQVILDTLFVMTMLSVIYRRFVPRVYIIFGEDGIYDIRPYVGAGFVKWDSINKMETLTTSFFREGYVKIFVDNADEIISSESGLKRYILKQRMKKYKTPILLSSYRTNYAFNELVTLIIERLKEKQMDIISN